MRTALLFLEKLERLRERHPRVQQGFELGVEEQEVLAADLFRTRKEGETKP
jgi:hypothetical protein